MKREKEELLLTLLELEREKEELLVTLLEPEEVEAEGSD